jgi:hypothetical protein
VTSSSGFSAGGEALDALGTLPGLKVAVVDVLGQLGENAGATAAETLSIIVGAGAILFQSPIEEASASPCL